jgi:threonine aldolase
VSICFSKALGAPAGSAVAGPRDLIAEALRHRKALGGGMRQAGVLAAAALYALEHHVERLAEDHANARRLADGIGNIRGLRLDTERVDTNIVFFRADPAWGTAAELSAGLKERGVLMLPTGPNTLRAVTHLDVTTADVTRAIAAIEETLVRANQPR